MSAAGAGSGRAATREWDAETYERVAGPQEEWARELLARLPLRGDETVLDAGCGGGRVTRMLVERLPRGRVIAVDGSAAMVDSVRSVLRPRDRALVADLAGLRLDEPVDVVFSNAVFHWIEDHDRLFASLRSVLVAGGRLHVQFGGEGNVEGLRRAIERAADEEPFAVALGDWRRPWNFATAEATHARLERAGFEDVRCWTHDREVVPDDPGAFLRTVGLGPHLARLPEELGEPFVERVRELATAPSGELVLHYVRLNAEARRAP